MWLSFGAMDQELNQCLNAIPSFVSQLEAQVHSSDLNLIEWLTMRAELFLQLLRVLTGTRNITLIGCLVVLCDFLVYQVTHLLYMILDVCLLLSL